MVQTKVPTESLIKRHLFTVDDYHKMGEVGILTPEDRVELIEGEIVEMSPIGRPHLSSVDRLNELFVQGLAGRAIVRVQGSIRLSIRSEPEPDFVLLRRRDDFYRDVDAGPEDVLLIVEVSDTSLAYDRGVKVGLYARSGIREVWIEDVKGETITSHSDPGPEGYRTVKVCRRGERLSPLAFPDFELTVDQILG